jgi:hypothetical protein
MQAVQRWARQLCSFVGTTVLEAAPDGHIYNSFVLCSPNGSFITLANQWVAG